MKQIPNLFTLLNLFLGCIAIVFILQTGEAILQIDQVGASQVFFPERMAWGAVLIFGAAIVDFFDGFLARLLNVPSERGKQLDSLCDVVSFGVAPGLILYQLLRLGYAQQEGGLDVSFSLLLPAFIFTAAVAWRLAKFNVSTNQSDSFRGVPSPAAGLLVASFPLIIWNEYFQLQGYFINVWILYSAIFLLSFLMISNREFMAMKFKNYSFQNNVLKYMFLILSVVSIIFIRWLAVPVIFVLYVLFSAFSKSSIVTDANKQTLDVTV